MNAPIANPDANGGCLKRVVRALLPRFVGHYACEKTITKPWIEYWPGDEVWADTIHCHIYWRGTSHWWLFALPDWLCRGGKSHNAKCPNNQAQ